MGESILTTNALGHDYKIIRYRRCITNLRVQCVVHLDDSNPKPHQNQSPSPFSYEIILFDHINLLHLFRLSFPIKTRHTLTREHANSLCLDWPKTKHLQSKKNKRTIKYSAVNRLVETTTRRRSRVVPSTANRRTSRWTSHSSRHCNTASDRWAGCPDPRCTAPANYLEHEAIHAKQWSQRLKTY